MFYTIAHILLIKFSHRAFSFNTFLTIKDLHSLTRLFPTRCLYLFEMLFLKHRLLDAVLINLLPFRMYYCWHFSAYH